MSIGVALVDMSYLTIVSYSEFLTTDLLAFILPSCSILCDRNLLSDFAHVCIAKAKLCLSSQYSVLICDQGQAMSKDVTTSPNDDVNVDMKLGGIGGVRSHVFEGQFGAIVDFVEEAGKGGPEMVEGMHRKTWGL